MFRESRDQAGVRFHPLLRSESGGLKAINARHITITFVSWLPERRLVL